MRLRYVLAGLAALTVFVTSRPARAQSDAPGFHPKIKPEVTIPRSDAAVRIDGELDDLLWTAAAVITGFTEVQPQEMREARVETEVRVAYDENYLYVAFRAFDDPRSIRASLSNRDEIFRDDWVGVILDTYGDAVRAYEIFANPLGVQGDLLMTTSGEEPGFDLIYDSAGKITEDGYHVEMAIPFGSLRYPKVDAQEWKITFLRNHPRDSRRIYSWAAVTQDDPCLLCQTGTMRGISDIRAATKAEILPAIVGTQSGSRADAENPTSAFENGRFHPEASLNLRYNLTSSLSAEAAINPDFSQVESDAAQVDVNSTFALFYPERRPFFQEGTDLFNSYMDVIYTRSINNPIGAAKLNGNFGATTVAFVSAVDQHTPILLPFEERSELVEGGRSVSNILRARRTFGETTFLGAALTDRRLVSGGSGSLVSADFKTQFLGNYVIEAQAALSHTEEPYQETGYDEEVFGDGRTAALDGERFAGFGAYVSLDRRARHWSFDLSYRSASPTFRAANGFVTRNAYRTVRMDQAYDFYPASRFFDRITPNISLERGYNYGGRVKRESINPAIMGMLKGQTFVLLSYRLGNEVFRGVSFDNLGSWTVGMNSNFSRWISAFAFVNGGDEIARFADTPEVGTQLSIRGGLDIKPTQRLNFEPSVQYASLRDRTADEAFFSGIIVRTQTSFQFTRELSTRVIVQYNEFNGQLDVEPLISYRLNPFSIFYVGSTHDFVDFDAPHYLTPTRRQVFFKFQYLLRR